MNDLFQNACFIMTLMIILGVNVHAVSVSGKNRRLSVRWMVISIVSLFSIAAGQMLYLAAAKTGIVKQLMTAAAAGGFLFIAYHMLRLCVKGNRRPALLFLIIVFVTLYITIFSRYGSHLPWIKVNLMEMVDSLLHGSGEEARHLLLNIVLFIPIGIVFPFLDENYDHIEFCSFGLLLSSCIEATQLLLQMGECDIADVIGNTIGMLMGILMFPLSKKIVEIATGQKYRR